MSGSFQHPYLDLSQHLIRVVQLVPNGEDEPIHCNMSVVNLRARYAALSYVWGDDDPDEDIYINDQPFKVRKNLFQFLKLSRSKLMRHRAWFDPMFIDALCINQSKIAERNHQVRQMGDIYRSASYTVAWLGCGVSEVDNVYLVAARALGNMRYATWPGDTWKIVFDQLSYMGGDAVLESLCGLEYWSRLWVVPEVTLARKLFFAYGEREMDANVLFGLLANIKLLTYSDPRHERDDSLQNRGARWRRIIESSNANGFLDMFEDTGNINSSYRPTIEKISFSTLALAHGLRKCLDPRDRVFALMAISEDYASWQVNYEDSAATLFKKLQLTNTGKFSLRFVKQLSNMLEPDLQVSEADGGADEMNFDGTPMFRFDTGIFDIIYPHEIDHDSETSYYLPSGLTSSELRFCKIFKTYISLIILPTGNDLVFSVFGVISGKNVGHVRWLRHRCTIIAES